MAGDGAHDSAQRLLAFLDRFHDVPAAAWGISTGVVTIYAACYAIAAPRWPMALALGALVGVAALSALIAGMYTLARPSRSDRMMAARRDYDAGCLALEDKRYPEAMEAFERAATQDECYLHLSKYGRACLRLGRYEDAIRVLTRCRDLAPTPSLQRTASRNRGVAFMVTRQWGAALSDFSGYIDSNKKEGIIRRQRALVHLARGEMQEAEDDARQAVDNAGSHSAPHATLAVVLAALVDREGAQKQLNKANQLSPDNANALYALAQANVALGQLDEAYRRLETAIQTDSRFSPRARLDPFLEQLKIADSARFEGAVAVNEWKLLGMLKDEA